MAVVLALVAGACGSTLHVSDRTPDVSGPAGPPARAAVAGGRYVRPVVVSGLRITPLPAGEKPLGLDWDEARSVVEATDAFDTGFGEAILGYGDVTLAGIRLPAGVPALRARPAWVAIVWDFSASCPAVLLPASGGTTPTPPTTLAPYVTPYTAIVVYAQGGHGALVYDGRGSAPCGGSVQAPTVTTTLEQVSVPWTMVGGTAMSPQLDYRAPRCATLYGSSGDDHGGRLEVTIDVHQPLDLTGCGPTVSRRVGSGMVPIPGEHPVTSLAHGPLGPVVGSGTVPIAGAPT